VDNYLVTLPARVKKEYEIFKIMILLQKQFGCQKFLWNINYVKVYSKNLIILLDRVESVVVILKKKIPASHSADLIFVLFLPVAFVDVSFCPFSVTGRDLFNSDSRVFAVVAVLVKIWVGSAVRQGRVEEAAARSAESALHSSSVVAELVDPFFLRWKLGKVVKQDLFGKLVQAVQTLLRGSRWNLKLQLNFLEFVKKWRSVDLCQKVLNFEY
jgi:hypothetical protein